MLDRFRKFIREWKPIHLCWWYQKKGKQIPRYFIGQSSSSSSSGPCGGATLYEHQNTVWNEVLSSIWGSAWCCQTFTPSIAHTVTCVRLALDRIGIGNFTITVSIKAVDGNHHPTGVALCSGTISTNNLGDQWDEISMGAGANLSASTEYAIEVKCPDATDGNQARGYGDSTGDYAGGYGQWSNDSGDTWNDTVWDYAFEEYGDTSSSSSSCSSSFSSSSSSFSSSSSSESSQSSSSSSEQCFDYTKFENHTTPDNSNFTIGGNIQIAQTFTPSISHVINCVNVKIGTEGTPVGNLDVQIQDTDGAGKPNGNVLASASITVASIVAHEWRGIVLNSGSFLSAASKYALVLKAPNMPGQIGDRVFWKSDSTEGYAAGQACFTNDAGANWALESRDCLFEEWGNQSSSSSSSSSSILSCSSSSSSGSFSSSSSSSAVPCPIDCELCYDCYFVTVPEFICDFNTCGGQAILERSGNCEWEDLDGGDLGNMMVFLYCSEGFWILEICCDSIINTCIYKKALVEEGECPEGWYEFDLDASNCGANCPAGPLQLTGDECPSSSSSCSSLSYSSSSSCSSSYSWSSTSSSFSSSSSSLSSSSSCSSSISSSSSSSGCISCSSSSSASCWTCPSVGACEAQCSPCYSFDYPLSWCDGNYIGGNIILDNRYIGFCSWYAWGKGTYWNTDASIICNANWWTLTVSPSINPDANCIYKKCCDEEDDCPDGIYALDPWLSTCPEGCPSQTIEVSESSCFSSSSSSSSCSSSSYSSSSSFSSSSNSSCSSSSYSSSSSLSLSSSSSISLSNSLSSSSSVSFSSSSSSISCVYDTQQDHCILDDNDVISIAGTKWLAQSFTPSVSYRVCRVKVKVDKNGTPPAVTTFGIRNTDGNGHPIGSDLCSGILGPGHAAGWIEIILGAGYSLSQDIKYALVARAPSTDSGDCWRWRFDNTAGSYTRGNALDSDDSGGTWGDLAQGDEDWMFDLYGD
ncbi:hypothetical protein KAW50_02740, partial [candidate division WOR-3 bacterium]|nr:hypothetical protein [candidate division WOR-3 bacterium]